MTKVQTLIGPQVTDLYIQTRDEIATLRRDRAAINAEIREKVEDLRELRKYVRLFDPQVLADEQATDDSSDE
jgi:hypothetical protein